VEKPEVVLLARAHYVSWTSIKTRAKEVVDYLVLMM
jgi:hypothetical protein